jgi:hypothetical protein
MIRTFAAFVVLEVIDRHSTTMRMDILEAEEI